MTGQTPEQPLAERVAAELSRCRQRGLDDLDVTTPHQQPVPAPELELLAAQYSKAKQLDVYGRAARIRALIRDGLNAYAEQGNEAESRFIRSLFFNTSETDKSPSELLADATTASGLDERRFADYRRSAFGRFAEFLITFVGQVMAAATTPRPRKHFPLVWVSAGIAGLVVIAAVVTSVLLATNHHATATPHATSSATTPHASAGPYVPGKTYTEETGEFGAPTFTNPHSPAVTGVKVQPYEKVQVSCKVFAPTIPSISPDGYWYRIGSKPWANKYYAAANTFLNGDKVGGPTLHNTDFKVPDCPS
jgi:hypothetical protein